MEEKYNLKRNRLNNYRIFAIKENIVFCPNNSAVLVRDRQTGMVYAFTHWEKVYFIEYDILGLVDFTS